MRVLTIDDHILFRRCMVDFLSIQEDIIVVGEAAAPDAALVMVNELKPDIALVDIDLGGKDGLTLARDILQSCPNVAIVILSASQHENQMVRAIQIGAKGYLVKDIEPEDLLVALRQVMDGELVFPCSFLVRQIRNQLTGHRSPATSSEEGGLTQREREVLQLVSSGLTDKQVARRLSISENTIKNHMKHIRNKLGATNRVQAIILGIQLGVVKNSSQEIIQ